MEKLTDAREYRIAVVPGDGIGPEVSHAAVQVLECAVAGNALVKFTQHDAGAACYLDTGTAFPQATRDACLSADAVLHGAAGMPGVLHPDGTEAGQDFSMQIRASLDLFANIRPIKLMQGAPQRLNSVSPGDMDFVIVRENTEGLYAARSGGNVLRDELATDTLVVTRKGVERIVHCAARLAQAGSGAPADGVKRVTIVDKANILRSYAIFRQVATEVLADYPEVEVDYVIVDAMTVHMIERPQHFNVIVCENLVGDILSDLGAALMGGLGLAPSGETGIKHGMFQGSHGSAPSIAGKDQANPVACILSAARMLSWLGDMHNDSALQSAAARIEQATERVLAAGKHITPDIGGSASSSACTTAICDSLTLDG